MCVPLLIAVGAGIAAVGSLAAGSAAAAGHEFNAAQATQQAELEQEKAKFDIARTRDNTKRVLGAQRAGYSAAGVALEGSPQEIAFDTLSESEKDIYAIQWGANVRSANYQNEAAMSRFNASTAKSAGYLNAAGAIVGGFGKIAEIGSGGTAFGGKSTKMGNTIFDTPSYGVTGVAPYSRR